jgi:hypothetical protein
MNTSTQTVLEVVVVILGIVLMIGGIVTGKHGATVVGVIISGVAVQRVMALRKRGQSGDKQ